MRGEKPVEEESLEDTAIPLEETIEETPEFELDTEIADDVDSEHKAFYNSLDEEEKMLLTLRDELYDRSWKKEERDLRDRLKGRPYIPKLFTRIDADLERIKKMRSYEKKHGVNLADYKDAEQNTK